MAESEEELKSLLMKVKEESGKAGFKINIQKTNIMASGPITSWHKFSGTLWLTGCREVTKTKGRKRVRDSWILESE